MALEQKLSFKMSQRLVMTPSLQQAIKLLQMSKLELVEEVQQELLENPVLEELLSDPTTPTEQADRDESSDAKSESDDNPFEEIDYDAYFQDYDREYTPHSPREISDELPTFENTLAEPVRLADHLIEQLDLATSSDEVKTIGRAIIGNLDDDGYLKATLEEIQQEGSYERDSVERTLELIQGLDPSGIAARDLVECLCIQLKAIGEDGTAAETIVRHHLDKLQNRRFKELAETLGFEMDALREEIELIRSLDPRPGQRFNATAGNYVIPDVHVVKIDDEYQILLNEDGLPRLRISPTYRRMVSKASAASTPSEAKEYVRNKLRSAFRLIKSLEERQRTIYKVARSIVKFQRGFLDYGIEQIRPLVLKDVADDIGMHESTVSRVVNQKYMHTHRGVYEMRYFFHSGIETTRGASVSSLTVKERIRKIIAEEDRNKPLSDSAIVKILQSENLKIARRTVAKYREELNISSSSERRRVFQ